MPTGDGCQGRYVLQQHALVRAKCANATVYTVQYKAVGKVLVT